MIVDASSLSRPRDAWPDRPHRPGELRWRRFALSWLIAISRSRPHRLAPVIGCWPEPALLESGPGFGESGRWSIFTARPRLVFEATGAAWSIVDESGGRETGRGRRPGCSGPVAPTVRAGRSERRSLTRIPTRPVPGGPDRLLRLRPGPAARTPAAEGAARLAAARHPVRPVRHGGHRRPPDRRGRAPGLRPARRGGRGLSPARPGVAPDAPAAQRPQPAAARGSGRSPATSRRTTTATGCAGPSSTSRPATSSRSTSRSGSSPWAVPSRSTSTSGSRRQPRPVLRRSCNGTTWPSSAPARSGSTRPAATGIVTRPIKGTRPRGQTAEDDARLADELRCQPQGPRRADHDRRPRTQRPGPGLPLRLGPGRRPARRSRASPRSITWSPRSRAGSAPTPARSTSSAPSSPAARSPAPRRSAPWRSSTSWSRPARSLYTGAIGYFSRGGTSAFNIAIRTMLVEGDRVSYQVGGGIVADSDPEAEYERRLHKGAGLRAVLEGAGEGGRAVDLGRRPDRARRRADDQRPRPDLRARPRPVRDAPDLERTRLPCCRGTWRG